MGVPDLGGEFVWTVEQMRLAQIVHEWRPTPESEMAKGTYESQVDRMIERYREIRVFGNARAVEQRIPFGNEGKEHCTGGNGGRK